jgi:hypothetical protein
MLLHPPSNSGTFFEKESVIAIFLYKANPSNNNITIFPNIEARKKLFMGLTIKTKINKIESIMQMHTYFVPFA